MTTATAAFDIDADFVAEYTSIFNACTSIREIENVAAGIDFAPDGNPLMPSVDAGITDAYEAAVQRISVTDWSALTIPVANRWAEADKATPATTTDFVSDHTPRAAAIRPADALVYVIVETGLIVVDRKSSNKVKQYYNPTASSLARLQRVLAGFLKPHYSWREYAFEKAVVAGHFLYQQPAPPAAQAPAIATDEDDDTSPAEFINYGGHRSDALPITKRITPRTYRIGRLPVTEFDAFLNEEFIGSFGSYAETEEALDRLAFDLLKRGLIGDAALHLAA